LLLLGTGLDDLVRYQTRDGLEHQLRPEQLKEDGVKRFSPRFVVLRPTVDEMDVLLGILR
jgi:hypothetical protein